MKKQIILLFLLISTMTLFGQTKNYMDQNYIELTGKAEIEITPDTVVLSIEINEANSKNRRNLADMEQDLFRVLLRHNISIDKDLKVKNLNSYFQHFKYKKEQIILRKQYELTVREAKKLSTLFPALEKANISNIRILRLTHSKIEDFKQEVRILAIKNAQKKAVAYTNAIGQNTGKAIMIQEQSDPSHYYRGELMSSKSRAVESSEIYQPDIQLADIKLTGKVRVIFAIN